MKTKLSFLITLIFCSTMTFATDSPSVSVVGTAKHIFKLTYKTQVASKVQVTIFNSQGEEVFTETFKDIKNFSRPYNFSSLPEGEYTIEVKDESGRKVEKVNYNQGTVQSLISVTKLTSAPEKYMLTSVTDGDNEITVSILDANDQLLYNETLNVSGNFGVIYNLVQEGKYTFIVSDKSGVTKKITN